MRYSDDIPYEQRRYWYFTLHGIGPGTIPKDLKVLDTREGINDKGSHGLFICLDGILNTSELKEFDLKELVPPEEEKSTCQTIKKYLLEEGYAILSSNIWEDSNEIHIFVEDGDWKHEHLRLVALMEQFGYEQIRKIDEPSDSDCYTAEHIFAKR